MKIEDILSKEEIEQYHQEWKNFKGKYVPETPYNVHSGMPVLGKPFQFKDKPLFRAHVFQERLRNFNPYFISNEYHNPIWHSQHYFIAVEQLYHAASNLLRDNPKLVGKDPEIKIKIRKPTFWTVHYKGISVELFIESLRKTADYFVERGNFTFYRDDENQRMAELKALAFFQQRAYIKEMEALKEGDNNALERLTRKIEHQAIWQKRLYHPRTNLPDKDFLIEQLRQGRIPEAELHDFFSFWDKE